MKYLLSIVCALFMTAALAQGEMEPFHKISAFGNIQLILVPGDSYHVDAPERMEELKIKVDEGKLKISHKHNEKMWSNPTTVTVTYVKLTSLDVSAGAQAEHRGTMQAGDISISTDAGAQARLDIEASGIDVVVGEGGVLILTGKARVLEAKATTGAVLKASDLEAEQAYVRANTGGDIIVHALEHIEATAMMGGVITVIGEPSVVRINESLGGTVNH